jgi:SAM-dependent methyltransferase
MNFRQYAQRTWDEAAERYHAEILAATPRISGTMLDVGCDDGEWTDQVRERAGVQPDMVSGIEIVPERRALAEQRGFSVVGADLEQPWPFDGESFDLVHANQVIEHVKRLDHFVGETRRVLRTGGCAVICTENLASWHNIAAVVLGFMPFSLTNISSTGPIGNPFALHSGEPFTRGDSWQHIHVITLTALVGMFEAHGMVVETTFASGYHPLRGRLARQMAHRDPRHGHFIGLRARKATVGSSDAHVSAASS